MAANSGHYPFATRHVPCIFLENKNGDTFQYYHTIFDTYEAVRFDSCEPSKGDMINLVNELCLIQDKIKAEYGMPDFIQEPKVANVEALKVPMLMFYVWYKLGYGSTYTLSPRGANAYKSASFKAKHLYFLPPYLLET